MAAKSGAAARRRLAGCSDLRPGTYLRHRKDLIRVVDEHENQVLLEDCLSLEKRWEQPGALVRLGVEIVEPAE